MLRTIERFVSCEIHATDDGIGNVHDFYFDDEHWAIRYLVVETCTWLPYQRVLISPMAVRTVDWANRQILATLTKEQMRNGPAADTAETASRRHEALFNAYYGYPHYWTGPRVWAGAAYPSELLRDAGRRVRARVELKDPECAPAQREGRLGMPHTRGGSGDRARRGLRRG
jgi:hypothetical protein